MRRASGSSRPDESGKDVFVDHTSIVGAAIGSLAEGARVSCEVEFAGKVGAKAVKVKRL